MPCQTCQNGSLRFDKTDQDPVKKNPDPHIVFMILSQNDAGILGRKTQSETTFSETIWSEITTVYLVRKYFVRITSSGMAL